MARWRLIIGVAALGAAGAFFFRDKSQAAGLAAPRPAAKFFNGGLGLARGSRMLSAVASMDGEGLAASGAIRAPEARAALGAPRKIVKNGTVRLEVSDYAKARQELLDIAARHGAEVLEDSANDTPEKKSGSLSFKVGPARLEAFLAEAEKTGRLLWRNVSATDRGEEYVDLKSRLDNLRRVDKRLTDLLAFKTSKLSDVLQVEKELERVGGEIEQLLGRMQYIDALAAASRATVSLEEPIRRAAQAGSLLTDIRNRLVGAVSTFIRTGLALLSFTGFLLAVGLWAGVIGALAWSLKTCAAQWLARRGGV